MRKPKNPALSALVRECILKSDTPLAAHDVLIKIGNTDAMGSYNYKTNWHAINRIIMKMRMEGLVTAIPHTNGKNVMYIRTKTND